VQPSDYVRQLMAREGTAESGSIPSFMHPNIQETLDRSCNTAQDNNLSAVATKFIYCLELKSAAAATISESEGDLKTLHKAQEHSDWPL
jgi:hypothetical protein